MVKYLFLLFVIPTCNKEQLPERYDIVLCVGQSNMIGYRANYQPQDNGSTALLWNDTTWIVADGYLNWYSNISTPWTNYVWLSPANSFGKQAGYYHRNPKTGLVVNALEGSFIEQWDTLLLRKSIDRLNAALAATPNSRVSAILWHQGESDKFNPHKWMNHFKNIRRQVDSLVGYDVPIIVGQLAQDVNSPYQAINDTISKVQDIHDCYVVSSYGLATVDGTHFTSASQRVLGERYYDVYKTVK